MRTVCFHQNLRAAHQAIILILKRTRNRCHVFISVFLGRTVYSIYTIRIFHLFHQLLFIHGKLDCLSGRLCSQIVHSSLQALLTNIQVPITPYASNKYFVQFEQAYQFPSEEVHGRQFSVVRLRDVNVQGL